MILNQTFKALCLNLSKFGIDLVKIIKIKDLIFELNRWGLNSKDIAVRNVEVRANAKRCQSNEL